MAKTLQAAVIAMNSGDDKSANIAQASFYVEEAARAGARWIQLPEMFPYMGSYARLWDIAEEEGGPLWQTLSDLAKRHQVVLFAGSVQERPAGTGTKVYNTSYVFGPDGTQIAKYRKIHLFNLSGPDVLNSYRESDGFLSGSQLVTSHIDNLRVAHAICYDLRFPHFFAALASRSPEIDVLVAPSAFTKKTGEAHWQLLLRARAVESQCFVIAANQTGTHSSGKSSFGHGMIVDPWGEILADTGESPGIAYAELNLERLAAVRAMLPATKNRILEFS